MDLNLAQAEWTLGRYRFRVEELPELAAQMLMQGFEGPAILELASFHNPRTYSELPADLVDQAFAETGRPPLSNMDAVMRVVTPTARKIVDGGCAPVDGAKEILRLAPWGNPPAEMPGFHRLDELVDLWSFYRRSRAVYERQIKDVARGMLEQRGRSST